MALDLSMKRSALPLDLSLKRPLSPSVAVTCRQMACVTMPTAQIPMEMSNGHADMPTISRKRSLSNSSFYGQVVEGGCLKTHTPSSAPPFAAKRVCFAASVKIEPVDEDDDGHKKTTWCVRRKMLYRQRAQEQSTNSTCPANEKSSCEATAKQSNPAEVQKKAESSSPTPPGIRKHTPTADDHPLPTDPREWSRDDVHAWLRQIRTRCKLEDVDCSRFPMNGKGLCLLTPDMFLYRVPASGLLLYTDFIARMHRALAVEEKAAASTERQSPQAS